jgi:predicted glycosyltransferase
MKTEEEVRQRTKELLQLRPEDLITQYMFQEQEIERLNNIIEKLEQENAVLKTQVVNKDKYSYGIRMGSDKK